MLTGRAARSILREGMDSLGDRSQPSQLQPHSRLFRLWASLAEPASEAAEADPIVGLVIIFGQGLNKPALDSGVGAAPMCRILPRKQRRCARVLHSCPAARQKCGRSRPHLALLPAVSVGSGVCVCVGDVSSQSVVRVAHVTKSCPERTNESHQRACLYFRVSV